MMTESGVYADEPRDAPPRQPSNDANASCTQAPAADGEHRSLSPSNANNAAVFSTSTVSRSFSNNADLTQVAAKIESLKKWTVTTYKTTKRTINEHLGKAKKTIDKDLDERIEALRELERRYQEILTASRIFTAYFLSANKMQRALAEAMYQLSCKEDVLNTEFAAHSDALRGVSQGGELFVNALNGFVAALETVADKTIQDTFITIDHHDQARLEYDVYRSELEELRQNPNPNPQAADAVEQLERDVQTAKAKYEQLKEDVRVKLTLLEENRCKVMRRQIATIQHALLAYHSGSVTALESGGSPVADANSSLHDADPLRPHCPQSAAGASSFLEQ